MGKNVIVAGFHRSGTSLTSQLLHRSGLFLGYQLLGESLTNVYGHVEDKEILGLHDDILADNGLTWQVDSPVIPEVPEPHRQRMRQVIDQREAGHGVWGFKDPRVCLFLDTWKGLLPGARVLIVYRSPVETTSSLHKRAAIRSARRRGNRQFDRNFREVPDLALKMWLTHNGRLLDFAHRHPEDVLVLSFDTLRRELPLIRLLNQRWGLGLEEVATSEVFDPDVTTESDNRQPVANTEFIGEALDTWEALEQLRGETEQLLGSTAMSSKPLTAESFRSAEDVYDVLIENEFQNAEVEALQARVQELEQNQKEVRGQLKRTRIKLKQSQEEMRGQLKRKRIKLKQEQMKHEQTQTELEKAQKLAVPPQRKKELEGAERDLKLIVKRMSQSKLAPAFRLKEEFRELEQRYSK